MTTPQTSAEQDERLRALGQAAGELIHDLGGLISVMAGRISLAREEAALGRTPADELARIQADADEIRRMVLEVLDELRGVRPALEATFPVEATLEQVVKRWLLGSRSVTTILNSSLRGDIQVRGPRSFFSRGLGNLLRNAARHARSEIRLSMGLSDDRESIEIRVEDDGDGVAPELRDRLFDPFVTAGGGTGLGLSFARWGIERLGGTLTLDPEPSVLGGASFRVVLPVSSVARRSRPRSQSLLRERPEPHAPGPLAGLKVLVVDDDAAVRRTFGRLLRRSGAEAVEIDPEAWPSAESAVREIREEGADLVLLDLHLRGVTTDDLYPLLRRADPETSARVVFFTGGPAPQETFDRPVVNKMLAWDDLVLCILGAVQPRR